MQPGGQPDMQQLLAQAQEMQKQLMAAQEEIASSEIIGQAGNGLVAATMKGTGELVAIRIDPQIVDPADVETLQDLIIGALQDASTKASELATAKLGPLAQGFGGGGGPAGIAGSDFF